MVKLQVEEIISFIFLKFNPMLLDCCSVIKQQRKLIANILAVSRPFQKKDFSVISEKYIVGAVHICFFIK